MRYITLDMDGTMFDPWHCCGRLDRSHLGTDECRHIRWDTLDEVNELMNRPENTLAGVVVLSWRSGLEKVTREWFELAFPHLPLCGVFVPGSPDTLALGERAGRRIGNPSQWGFKQNVVRALTDIGHKISASFDDNEQVVAWIDEVTGTARQAPRLVKIQHHEWVAGYLGAPEPKPLQAYKSARPGARSWQDRTLFDVYNDSPEDDRTEQSDEAFIEEMLATRYAVPACLRRTED